MPLKRFVGLIALQEVLGSSMARVWVGGRSALSPQPVAIDPQGGCPYLGYRGCSFSGDLGPAASLLS